jgi:hypothetical protein
MILPFTIHSILFAVCYGRSIGTVNRTRFTSVDQLDTGTVWLYNQLTPQQYLCTTLSQYNNVLLFNNYVNGSCQLFFSLPCTYTMESNINSTIILLSPLSPINQTPCCSNLTRLITRISSSSLPTVFLTLPNYIVIDDLDYLAVLSSDIVLNRYNRTTMTLVSSTSMSYSPSLSYYF